MDITPHLTLTGTLQRSSPTKTASGAFADAYATVNSKLRLRISQPSRNRVLIGGQEASDLDPVVLFEPDEDVRLNDRVLITGGMPTQHVGTEWMINTAPVLPSVPVYKSATARRIETANG